VEPKPQRTVKIKPKREEKFMDKNKVQKYSVEY
jgi:hypothetical protein